MVVGTDSVDAKAPSGEGVLAIVVTYHPQPHALEPLLLSLSQQADVILVVDNTPDSGEVIAALLGPLHSRIKHLRLHRMGCNAGIAAAQNVGMRMALEDGYEYVLLADQDSLPSDTMVANLLSCCDRLKAGGVNVGCMCPEYFDETTAQAHRFQVQERGHVFYSSVAADAALPWQEIITSISSGTLIPRASMQEVGFMREEFFIDHVDTEWCHRARALGFRNYATASARLIHRLGDASFRAWYFGWRDHSLYSPLRLRYRFRNFILLSRLRHVPLRWTVRASWYWLGNAYAHCFFSNRRLASARAILAGLWDGALGRSGPITP